MAAIARLALLVLAVAVAVAIGSGYVLAPASANAGGAATPGFVYDSVPSPTTGLGKLHDGALRSYDDPAHASRASLRVPRRVVAAESAPAIVRGGETAATAYGRAIHKTFDYGPGFRREFSLPSGRRADAVNLRTREVVELKPNNPRAIALGRRQLDRYASELEALYPGAPFTRRLETYDRP